MKLETYTELHAHLSGSIPRDWLYREAKKKSINNLNLELLKKDKPDLDECFAIFPIIHEIIETEDDLLRATQAVIDNFYKNGVRALELRTTPKGVGFDEKIKRLTRLFKFAETYSKNLDDFKLSWIISINREKSLEEAFENLKLATNPKLTPYVVALDFCGNPSVSNFSNFREVFHTARQRGLKITLHCAELDTPEETDEIIEFKPDRLGHAAVLNKDQIDKILEYKIPVEVCLSSNIMTKACSSALDHPVSVWLEKSHPFSMCTDDISLFGSELKDEWKLLGESLRLDSNSLAKLIEASRALAF